MRASIVLTCLVLIFLCTVYANAEEGAKWVGIDEAVMEKIASEHGREASGPLINTDQGDLLLFLFLLAGAIGGFIAGYYYRMLMEAKPEIKTRVVNQNAN